MPVINPARNESLETVMTDSPKNENGHQVMSPQAFSARGLTDRCADPDVILGLVERGLELPGAPDLVGHILGCPHCLRVYAETRALKGLSTGTPKPKIAPAGLAANRRQTPWGGLGFGFAIGAAAVLAVGYLTFVPRFQANVDSLRAQLSRQNAVNKQAEQEQARLADRLKAAEGALKTSPGPDKLLKDDAAGLLEQVVLSGRLTVPTEILSFVAANREQGASEDNVALKLKGPTDTCTEVRQPVLVAVPYRDAKSPKVIVIDLDGNEVSTTPISTWSWHPVAPLKPGAIYQWSVEARLGGRTLVSPVASIKVLSVAEAARIAKQRELYAKQPLLLAAIYSRAGLLDAAEKALNQALQEHPRHTLAQGLLRDLQRTRKGGR